MMTGEPEVVDFSKLSLEERAAHKNFKARISAYEDLIKTFSRLYDDKSPEWSKYTSIVKAAPLDSHASAQEKGLEAALIYMENSSLGPRLVGDMMSGVILKCLTSTRARVKELGTSIVMMCVEIEKFEIVQDELTKGLDNKNPKVVTACATVYTQAIREFGAKIVKAKPLAKKLTTLLEDRDKNVREESKKFALILWHWIGPAFGKDLSTIKPQLLTELEAEYAKISSSRPQATRYLRSEQEKKNRAPGEAEPDEEPVDGVEEVNPDVDPYDLLQPEEILSKLPKDFYEKIEAKKWQDRKETLEALEVLLNKHPKLEGGDYADLVRALKRVVSKDSNVVVVALAVKCVTGLANGLKKKFSIYAPSVMGSLLEKFKEKKGVVLNPLKDAADAVYLCTSLEAISEDTIAALQNKNPAMKVEVALFLSRAFSKTPNKVFQDKKFIKTFITPLLANLNESDLAVRDAAAEALGVTYKAMGERGITPFLADIEPLKLAKIKDFAEKAVVLPPAKADAKPKVVKPAPSTASKPEKEAGSKASTTVAGPKKSGATIKKPSTTTAVPAPAAKKVSKPEPDSNSNYGFAPPSSRPSTAATSDDSSTSVRQQPPPNPNARVDITTKLGEGLLEKMGDKDWKKREEALEKLHSIIMEHPKIGPYLGDLTGAICQRLQDSNRGIALIAFLVLQNLATALGPNCKQHLRQFLPTILSQLGENRVNVRGNVLGCLSAWADQTSLEECFQGEMITDGLKQPSPLLRSELFWWLSPRMKVMKNPNKDDMATALPVLFSSIEDRNPEVRRSANDCVLGFMMHLGYDRMSHQASRLKPASKNAVMQALDKARILLPEKEKPSGTGSTPPRGKTATGSRYKPLKATASPNAPGSARQQGSSGGTTPQNSSPPTPNLRSPMQPNRSPSSSHGSVETLVISPPPLTPLETDSVDIMSAEGPMPSQRNLEIDDWNGLPHEFRIDFGGIERKYTKVREPMPPLVLLPTRTDFLDEPVRIPQTRHQTSSLSGTPRTSPESKKNLPVRAVETIDMIIVQVANSDLKKSMEALVQLEEVVQDSQVTEFMLTRIDQLLVCITMQMRKILPIFDTCDEKKMVEAEQAFMCVAQVLQAIYKQVELPRHVTLETIKDMIHVCLLVLAHPTVTRLESAEEMVRYFNILVVRIIERSDLNLSVCACMRLMTDALNLPHFNRILDLTMKCQWKVLKQLTAYMDSKVEYDYDISAFLQEFHIFICSHPFTSWKDRDGTPLKTMKTVVHSIVTKLGPAKVLAILHQTPALLHSDAGIYLQKLIDRELNMPSEGQAGEGPSVLAPTA